MKLEFAFLLLWIRLKTFYKAQNHLHFFCFNLFLLPLDPFLGWLVFSIFKSLSCTGDGNPSWYKLGLCFSFSFWAIFLSTWARISTASRACLVKWDVKWNSQWDTCLQLSSNSLLKSAGKSKTLCLLLLKRIYALEGWVFVFRECFNDATTASPVDVYKLSTLLMLSYNPKMKYWPSTTAST